MDHNFTLHLQEWLNTPDEQKDWDEGAVLLLQLSGNKIMYHNISVYPKGHAEFIKGQLEKYLSFRLQDLTHQQVQEMQRQVDAIVEKHPTIAQPVKKNTSSTEGEEFKAGKRGDHDQLPEEIQALYVENLDIVNKMRELHLRLRLLSTEEAACPDSERYPFLKELIALDKLLHANWDTYDHYVIGAEATNAEAISETSSSDNTEDKAISGAPDSQHNSDGEATEGEASSGVPKPQHNSDAEATEEETSSGVPEPQTSSEASPKPQKAKATRKRSAKSADK